MTSGPEGDLARLAWRINHTYCSHWLQRYITVSWSIMHMDMDRKVHMDREVQIPDKPNLQENMTFEN